MYETLGYYLAGQLAAACTPNQGMGCFPCCGVTSSTGAVQQSGHAALGAAVLILLGALVFRALLRKGGGGK